MKGIGKRASGIEKPSYWVSGSGGLSKGVSGIDDFTSGSQDSRELDRMELASVFRHERFIPGSRMSVMNFFRRQKSLQHERKAPRRGRTPWWHLDVSIPQPFLRLIPFRAPRAMMDQNPSCSAFYSPLRGLKPRLQEACSLGLGRGVKRTLKGELDVSVLRLGVRVLSQNPPQALCQVFVLDPQNIVFLYLRHGRRPLPSHAVLCACLGYLVAAPAAALPHCARLPLYA